MTDALGYIFAPDPSDAHRFHSKTGAAYDDPERRLRLAVLEGAILDLHPTAKGGGARVLQMHAAQWVDAGQTDTSPFSFRAVCAVLGFDARRIAVGISWPHCPRRRDEGVPCVSCQQQDRVARGHPAPSAPTAAPKVAFYLLVLDVILTVKAPCTAAALKLALGAALSREQIHSALSELRKRRLVRWTRSGYLATQGHHR